MEVDEYLESWKELINIQNLSKKVGRSKTMYQDLSKSLYALQIGRSHVVKATIRSKISQGTLQNERSHVVNPNINVPRPLKITIRSPNQPQSCSQGHHQKLIDNIRSLFKITRLHDYGQFGERLVVLEGLSTLMVQLSSCLF